MFGKSITLFKLFNFKVRLDISWIFIALLVSWTLASGFFPDHYKNLSASTYWVMGVIGAIGLFVSIIIHEFAHSFVARRFGLSIKGITLFIFGGVAEMEDEPPSARAEFFMAFSGPLTSIALGFVFLGLARWGKILDLPTPVIGILAYLKWINWVLAGFNLVPAFPLDGGRLLRSILWQVKGNLRWATRVSSQMGSAFGMVLIIMGVFYLLAGFLINGVWYFLIGMFLRGASQMSYQSMLIRKALEGETVKNFMENDPVTVPPDITISRLVQDYTYKYHFKMFPVVMEGKLNGCISTKEIKDIPRGEWEKKKVAEVLKTCSPENTVSPDTDAIKALSVMNKTGKSRLLVVQGDRLSGIITLKDLLRFFSLKLDLEGEEFKAS